MDFKRIWLSSNESLAINHPDIVNKVINKKLNKSKEPVASNSYDHGNVSIELHSPEQNAVLCNPESDLSQVSGSTNTISAEAKFIDRTYDPTWKIVCKARQLYQM